MIINSDLGDIPIASAAAAAIGAALFAATARKYCRKYREKKSVRAKKEGNEKRQRKAKKPKTWVKSSAKRKAQKAGPISLAVLIAVFPVALLACSLRIVGRSSSEIIGSRYDIVADHLYQAGFWDVEQTEIPDLAPSQIDQDGLVTQVRIGPIEHFSADLRMPCFIKPEIVYHTLALIKALISHPFLEFRATCSSSRFRACVSPFDPTFFAIEPIAAKER